MPSCTTATQRKWWKKIQEFQDPIIFYTGRFPLYLSGERFNNGEGGIELGPPFRMVSATPQNNLKKKIDETIKELEAISRHLVLIAPVPEAGWDVPKRVLSLLKNKPLSAQIKIFQEMELTTDLLRFTRRSRETVEVLKSKGMQKRSIISPASQLCNKTAEVCYLKRENEILYRDDDHLAPHVAERIIQTFLSPPPFD